MEALNNKSWESKRSNTVRVFWFIALVLGAEYSIIIPSLWFYLTEVIQTHNAHFMFGAIVSGFYVAALLSGALIPRYIDRTRDIRRSMMLLILMKMIGNFIYIIPLSAYFPLIGRLLQGMADFCLTIMTAETARAYVNEDTVKQLSTLNQCVYVSYVMAPASNVLFQFVNFSIYGFHVTYATFPSLLVGLSWFISLILTWLFVSNLSLEYDPKGNNEFAASKLIQSNSTILREGDIEMSHVHENMIKDANSSNDKHLHSNRQLHIQDLFKNFEFNIIILASCILAYPSLALFDITLPIIAASQFNFRPQHVGLLFSLAGVIFILTQCLVKILSKYFQEFYMILFGLAIFSMSIQCFVVALVAENKILGEASLICYIVLMAVGWSVEQVLLGTILTQFIPSSTQGFAEGIRRSFSLVSFIVAGIVTPLALNQIIVVCYLIQLLILVCFVLLVYRKRQFCNPRAIGTVAN